MLNVKGLSSVYMGQKTRIRVCRREREPRAQGGRECVIPRTGGALVLLLVTPVMLAMLVQPGGWDDDDGVEGRTINEGLMRV